jgi:hypothetical protein
VRLDYRSATFYDGGFLLLLGGVALYGLHNSFTGPSYLVAGVVGLALGIALALLIKRLGQPLIILVASVAAAFFILGGVVALHDLGGSALVPVPHTLSQLASTAVDGWKNMLTTLPPVDNGPLLALPYLLGLIAGAAGMVVSDRTRWVPAPAIVVGALLALVILLGVQSPSQTTVEGALFAGLVLAWLMIRAQRSRPHYFTGGSVRISRRVSGALLCVGATVLAAVIGTHVPGMNSSRTVLRSSVVPPFNVGQYPSPLVGFRRFTKGYSELQTDNGLYDKPLFQISGVPAGTLVRIASLDSYDGNVWGAGDVAGSVVDAGPSQSDTFQKVGQVINDPQRGKQLTATVKILNDALGVWVPTEGGLTGIKFTNPNEQAAASDFRYNLATSTGIMPQGLQPGDSYTFDAVLPASALSAHAQLASGALPEVASYTQFQQIATRWAGHAASSLQQIEAVAAYLRANGHYTDGGVGYQSFAAGHSLYRLTQFLSSSGELAGDDEQFAALMALMANELNVPARVVLGAHVPANGIVTGQDVHAWVELQAVNGSWLTLPQTDFMGTLPPKKQSQKSQPSVPSNAIPPPAPVQPPATAGEPLSNTIFHRVQGSKVTHPLPKAIIDVVAYVGTPLLVLALICGTIIALKLGRRRYRRKHGSPSRRLVFAWRDLMDNARDFGITAPTKATRREQATVLGFAGAAGSAARLDAVMFGSQPPDDEAAAAYWSHADEVRRELAVAHSRTRRIRAALNLVSLRPRRTQAK